MEFYIEQIKTFPTDLTIVLNKLLKQLNPNAVPLSDKDVEEIITSPDNGLFVARKSDTKEIVGMLTLVVYKIPVWKKAWLEDIVVDADYRKKGIATKLINAAIESAKADGVSSLNFTSSPERKDANKLYQKLGFEKRDTNVYQIKL